LPRFIGYFLSSGFLKKSIFLLSFLFKITENLFKTPVLNRFEHPNQKPTPHILQGFQQFEQSFEQVSVF